MPTKRSSPRKKTASKNKKAWVGRLKTIPYLKPVILLLVFVVAGVIGVPLISSATTSESLWSNSVTPKVLTWTDTHSIELGTKFKSSVTGYVSGIRFYKGPKNTGTHTGSLWDASGNRLAGVTFTNESASGWQTAQLASPVSIAANVTYIVSYHAPNGHYSLSPDFFKSGAVTNGHLSAPKFASNDPNGVNINSTSPTFPKNSGDGDSYFVDVIFNAQLINPQPAPAAPTGVSATIGDNNSVSLAWQASVSQNPISQYTIYRDGTKIGSVGTTTSYVDTTVVAGSTYTYQIQAIDNTGTLSALSAGTAVTIPTATPTPPSGGGGTGGTGGTTTGASTTCPLPAYPTPSCAGKPSSVAITNDIKGDYEARTDGQVIDGWHISGDLVIEAKNITVQNSEIDGTVINEVGPNHYGPFTVQDTTVGPATGCIGTPGIGESMYTAKRVYIRNHDDGFRVSGNDVSASDSYVHMCYLPPSVAPPDGSHADGVQNYCKGGSGDNLYDIPCHNITLDHNTFDNHDVIGNSAIYLGGAPDGKDIQNVTVTNNLMWGGGYTFYSIWYSGSKWTVTGNRIVSNNGWEYGPVDAEGTCSQQNWSGNSIVTADSSYAITSTVKPLDCIN